MNTFFLAEKIRPKTAFAYTEGETPVAHDLIPQLRGRTNLPFDLILKKVFKKASKLETSNDLSDLEHLWLDYQPNNLAWPLMSEKMKKVFENNLTGKESIVWMEVLVKSILEKKLYFIPRFEKQLDVLDEQKTLFVSGTKHIIKPVFSLTKISEYSLFYSPQLFWEITSSLYINEGLKNAIQNEKLTGIGFERISVSE